MTERATSNQGIQVGVQSLAGTGVAAGKKLLALSVKPAIKSELDDFTAAGNKYASMVALGKEWTESKLEGRMTFNEIVYLFNSLVTGASPTLLSGTAYSHTFESLTSGADSPEYLTVEHGDSVRADKFIDGLVKSLKLSGTRKELKIDGTMVGGALQDGITMTSTPASIPLVPCLPTQVDIYLADTAAGLSGATALTRALSWEWALSDRWENIWPIGSAFGTGPAGQVEGQPKFECKLKMEADAAGMGLLTQLRSGASKFMRIKIEGATIASTYKYLIQIDSALKVIDASEFSDEDKLVGIEWTFLGVHDATWGKAFSILCQNTVSAL